MIYDLYYDEKKKQPSLLHTNKKLLSRWNCESKKSLIDYLIIQKNACAICPTPSREKPNLMRRKKIESLRYYIVETYWPIWFWFYNKTNQPSSGVYLYSCNQKQSHYYCNNLNSYDDIQLGHAVVLAERGPFMFSRVIQNDDDDQTIYIWKLFFY